MALPYYFLAVVFLAVLLLTLVCLVIIYKVAIDYLDGKYSYDKLEPEEDEEEVIAYFDKGPLTAKQVTIVTPLAEEAEQATEFDSGYIEIGLKYIKENFYFAGLIKNISGFPSKAEGGPNRVLFHVTLKSSRGVRKRKTSSISIKKVKLTIPFGFKNVREEDISSGTLRLRLYGRREKLGVAIGREVCYGEAIMDLNKLHLGEEGTINTIKLVATAPQFPMKQRTDF